MESNEEKNGEESRNELIPEESVETSKLVQENPKDATYPFKNAIAPVTVHTELENYVLRSHTLQEIMTKTTTPTITKHLVLSVSACQEVPA